MTSDTKNILFDKELTPGAFNAINTCLRIKPNERVTVIADQENIEIANSLIYEIKNVGSKFNLFVLEDFATRPLTKMPKIILEDLSKSQASIYCCIAKTGELQSRVQMISVINQYRLRHGHMVNINRQIMIEGMRADFIAIDNESQRLVEKARKAKTIFAKSKNGTNIKAEFSPDLKWVKTSGIITEEKWGNLPGGEIFTSPQNINGLFVVDGVVGDYLCEKYGDLNDTPLFIEIKDSRIKHLECSNKELLDEFTAYTMTDENSNRVGEFAIGTNTAVKNIIGHILQDEKIPGIHIAFGHPYCEHTGQTWKSSTHIDCVGRDFDIWFDDEKIMENGKFIF